MCVQFRKVVFLADNPKKNRLLSAPAKNICINPCISKANFLSMNNTEHDIFLWNRFKEGCSESFVLIFRNYYNPLFNYGCKITDNPTLVEDSIQELFMDFWRSKNKPAIVSLKAYLFKAYKFKLIKSLKSVKTNNFISEIHEHQFELSHEMFMIVAQDDKALSQKVYNALQELSSRQKEIHLFKILSKPEL